MKYIKIFNSVEDQASQRINNYFEPWISYVPNVGLRFNIRKFSIITYDENTKDKTVALVNFFINDVKYKHHKVIAFVNGTQDGIYTVTGSEQTSYDNTYNWLTKTATLSGSGSLDGLSAQIRYTTNIKVTPNTTTVSVVNNQFSPTIVFWAVDEE